MTLFKACFLFIVTVSSAGAQEVGSVEQGRRLAEEICAQCHLVHKVRGLSTDLNAPRFEDIANSPGMTSAALAKALQTSHQKMPNIVIKDEQADSLIAYILSLKSGD
jgi:mono/diheme cytochrome c family protein